MCNLVSSVTEQIPGSFFKSGLSLFKKFIFYLEFLLSNGHLHSVVTKGGLCPHIVLLPSFSKITGSDTTCKLWPFLSNFSTLSLNFVIKFYCFFLLSDMLLFTDSLPKDARNGAIMGFLAPFLQSVLHIATGRFLQFFACALFHHKTLVPVWVKLTMPYELEGPPR